MKEETQSLKKPLKQYGDPLDSVLKDLCEAVGADYYTIDFEKSDWYYKHNWTFKQEAIFVKELTSKVKENPKFYRELFDVKNNRKTKQSIEMFLFNYGWKYTNVTNQENN
jgi:hypothetical protein